MSPYKTNGTLFSEKQYTVPDMTHLTGLPVNINIMQHGNQNLVKQGLQA